MKKNIILTTLLLFSLIAHANVRLPKIFGDNMVLQRDHEIIIWGWADPKEKITIQLNKQTKTANADSQGKWKISLGPELAGGPYSLSVKGKNTITLSNILIGDVWVCSGQSNMEWRVSTSDNAKQEIQEGNFPQIRHFKVPLTVASEPKADITGGEWKICSPETVGDFTAVGYFFARELQHELNVPIGLINTSWGGTHSETWTSRRAFENSEEFKSMIAAMPKLNLDSLANVRKAETLKKIKTLQGSVDDNQISETWKNSEVNDSQWPQMKLPGLWEQQQLPNMDGIVWFRKAFTITAGDAAKPAILELAMIDDTDITYINGVEVGKTNAYNLPRKYNIQAGVLKEGRNVIAVRVLDTGGGGGIYGDSESLTLTMGSQHISLAGNWAFRVASVSEGTTSIGPNSYPTLLFNAMLNPLIPYSIKGAIWYQGESNAGRAYQYRKAFPLMIADWREHWKQGDFPFYFVQLASYNAGNGNSKNGSNWAELREAQTLTLSLPNTGMAVTTDIGNANDIHPKNKQDVGKRLAAVALHNTYGKNNVFSGPTYQSMKTDGNKIILTFSNIGSGLMTKDKYSYVKGFEIAGSDQQFHYAKAFIEGDHVVVYQDGIQSPVAVRFGWTDDAGENNLFNKEGFPAPPFRTDDWKGITELAKFRIGQ